MARARDDEDYDTSHIPDYPSWYMVFPSFLFITGLGLCTAAIYALAQDKAPSRKFIPYNTLMLALLTIIFSFYHMIAEGSARSYNYWAILIPNSFLCLWFTASWIVVAIFLEKKFDGDGKFEDEVFDLETVQLTFCVLGSAISFVSVVLWGIAVYKHRSAGGLSTSARSPRTIIDYQESDTEEGTESGRESDNVNTGQIDGSGAASDNVNIRQMNGSRIASDNTSSVMDGNTSGDTNTCLADGNRNTSNDITSQDQMSVHYVPDHPYHPLRMHPVDSMGTIRSVAPDITQNEKETIEKAEQGSGGPNAAIPLASPSLPPTLCTCEHLHM